MFIAGIISPQAGFDPPAAKDNFVWTLLVTLPPKPGLTWQPAIYNDFLLSWAILIEKNVINIYGNFKVEVALASEKNFRIFNICMCHLFENTNINIADDGTCHNFVIAIFVSFTFKVKPQIQHFCEWFTFWNFKDNCFHVKYLFMLL